MALQDEYDLENLVNEAERLVFEELERQIDQMVSACRCHDCILDMAAFALNKVKPYYRVSLLGGLYARAVDHTDYPKTISKAVSEAISKVQSNPSHD